MAGSSPVPEPAPDAATTDAGGRVRAPGALGVLQAFVNTWDIEAGIDRLDSPAALRAWLAEHGLPGDGSIDAADLARAVELREALRESLEANAHLRAAPTDGTDRLSRAAASIPLVVRLGPAGPAVGPARGQGIDAALGFLLATAATAVADGTWARLKACRNDACRWAYWDTSRNHAGVWCTMALCGNRAKGRAFRERARSAPA